MESRPSVLKQKNNREEIKRGREREREREGEFKLLQGVASI